MNEQYLYMVLATSKSNPQYSTIKVGYTDDPIRRLKQLRRKNKNFEYSDMALFKHKTKQLYYRYDEEALHEKNRFHSVRLGKDSLPDGHTEHYDIDYMPDLYDQIIGMGYYWLNEPVQTNENAMFAW
ncbi:GIY-YIG nuclease family protein [Klebsiella aerogenes]